MIDLEVEYNEILFDIYLYYALNALASPSPLVRTSGLRILNTVAYQHYEGIFNVIDKMHLLINDNYWEVNVQLMKLACFLILKIDPNKEGLIEEIPKGTKQTTKEKAQFERNVVRAKLEMLNEIVNKSISARNHENVIKLGIIYIIPILEKNPVFYPKLLELLLLVKEEERNKIMTPSEAERIYIYIYNI